MNLSRMGLFLISMLLCIAGIAFWFSTEWDVYTKAILSGFCLFFGCINFYILKDFK